MRPSDGDGEPVRLAVEPLEERLMLSASQELAGVLAAPEVWLDEATEAGLVVQRVPLGSVADLADPSHLGFDEDTSMYIGTEEDPLADHDAPPSGASYMLYEHWGGTWSDAEKMPSHSSEDSLMCWAATGSNVLEWTGWGEVAGLTNTDEMFVYYQDHWTNAGGLMQFGWDWWFDGTNDSQGWSGWSQVDVPGGGFYTSENFSEYYHEVDFWGSGDFSQTMQTIDQYLHAGYGLGLGVYGDSGGGHAITCWGFNYDPANPSDYVGMWVTDSDDYKHLDSPPDSLRYYEVAYSSDKWYLQDFYGRNDWYIGAVQGLESKPAIGNQAPVITGLPDRTLTENTSLDNTIDLWAYASDAESPVADLVFSITGNTQPDCGLTIDSNRYVDISPTTDWTGASDVTIQVSDGERTNTDVFRITVQPEPEPVTPQGLPYAEAFDAVLPGAAEGWEYYSTNDGRIRVANGQLQMDDAVDGSTYALNEAVLHLDLAGQSGVKLTFDHLKNGDEDHTLVTTFVGHSEGDGVAFSADGTNWHKLTDLSESFTARMFDLDAAVAAAGVSYTSDFQIKFQQYDNYTWGVDGRAIDNVMVDVLTNNQAPTIASLSASPDPVTRGDNLTLAAASVLDLDGQVVAVRFYRDSNDNGTLDIGADQLLGADTSASGGWTWSGSTAAFPVGVNRYFAQAEDDDGALSDAADVTGTVQAPATPVTPAALPYSQDFSSGLPGGADGWEYYSTSEGRIRVVGGVLQMDDATPASAFSLNEAILHLDLDSAQNVTLTFDHVNSGDENNLLPTSFSGHADADGVSFSTDSVTWHKLTDLDESFTGRVFDLDAAVAAVGLGYTSDFQIKFQQYDNYDWGVDGRGFDNISVSSVALTPQAIPYSQTFSAGRPDGAAGWEYYSTEGGRIQVADGRLRMDDNAVSAWTNSLNEAILHLDLAGASNVILTLDHVSAYDENHPLPSTWNGHTEGDGIAVSADGVTWHKVTDLTSDFSGRAFDLDPVVTAAGIAYTSDFQIKFQQADNYNWGTDGRAFDNISVALGAPNQPPEITSLDAAPDPLYQGDDLTLTALGASDSDGQVTAVRFYRDANGNGTLETGTDELLGADTNGADGWSLTASTSGLALGAHTFLAQAEDDDGALSNVSSASATVQESVGEIHGSKWNDVDGDGLWDAGEAGLAGWTIYLDQNRNGQLDAGETSTTTDANGDFAFASLSPGVYYVAAAEQTGWVQTYAGIGVPQQTASVAGGEDGLDADYLDSLVDGVLSAPGIPESVGTIEDYWQLVPTYADIPEYTWHYGCSPTAAGMLFAWWDSQPGTTDLFEGDASTWWGDASESSQGGAKTMVASASHIVSGQENGYTYGDWHDSASYPNHQNSPASLADFMKTENGGTYRSRMAAGFEDFAAWDASWTATSEAYTASATTYYTASGWTFDDFKNEMAAGYPVHLGITGHSILALGWWDQSTPQDPDNYGYICYTTWSGWGLTEWRWDGADVPGGRDVYGATYLRVQGNAGGDVQVTLNAGDVVSNVIFGSHQETSTAPTSVNLLPASDTGAASNDDLTNLDNSTAAKALQFLVSGTVQGATVTLYANGTAIGSAVAAGTSTTVATNGAADLADGQWNVTARQTSVGSSESADSPELAVTVDTIGPRVTAMTPQPGSAQTAAATIALTFGETLDPAAVSAGGIVVSAGGTPARGAVAYDVGAGLLTWTPDAPLGGGAYQVTLGADTGAWVDAAGNALDGEFAGALPSGDGAPGGDFVATFDVTVPNQAPTIDSLVATPDTVTQGDDLTLEAQGVGDSDGQVLLVTFYHDTNNDGALDAGDQMLGVDALGADGWSWTFATHALPTGVNRFFARAQDDDGASGDPVTATATVADSPVIATWQSGNATVTVMDSDGQQSATASDFAVLFGANDRVASIRLSGSRSMTGVSITISGAASVGAITDARTGAIGDLAFIASNVGVTSVSLKGGIAGHDLNGMTIGGLTFDTDVDGDGDTTDLTAVYAGGRLGMLIARGTHKIAGDVVADGNVGLVQALGTTISGDLVSLSGNITTVMTISGGAVTGDIRAAGSIGTILATNGIGAAGSTIDAGGNIAALLVTSGAIQSSIHAHGAGDRAIGVILATGGGLLGDVTSAGGIGVILATGGGLLGDVTSAGGIAAILATGGAIAGNVSAGGPIGVVMAGQGISGAISAERVGTIFALGGDVAGAVTATGTGVRAVGAVMAARGSITGDITSAGGVGVVMAASGAVAGNITAAGAVNVILAGQGVTGNVLASQINVLFAIGGNVAGNVTATGVGARAIGVVMAVRGDVSGDVTSAGGISMVLAGQSIRGNVTGAKITTVMAVGGDIAGNLTATGTGTGALGNVLAFRGSITGDIVSGGSIGMVLAGTNIGGATQRSAITAGESVGTIMSIGGDVHSFITAGGSVRAILATRGSVRDSRVRAAGDVGVVLAANVTGTYIAARRVNTVLVLGNVTGSLIAGGYDFGADGAIGGTDDRLSSGSVGTVLVMGDMSGSNVAAGVDPGADGQWASDDDVSSATDSRIGVVRVIGSLTGSAEAGERFGIVADAGPVAVSAANGAVTVNAGDDAQQFADTNVYVAVV